MGKDLKMSGNFLALEKTSIQYKSLCLKYLKQLIEHQVPLNLENNNKKYIKVLY